MANADFSNQKQTVGGFDADSYRAAPKTESAAQLTPLQKKLAAAEKALPAALGKQATAAALSVVIMAAAFVGFGGAKLKSRYNEAKLWYTVGVSADAGYNLSEELILRENTAANIITTGRNTLGDSAEVQAAQAALDEFASCRADDGPMHTLYQLNETLGTAIDQLYGKLQEQAADPMKMGAVQGQYSQFNSAATIIANLSYNQTVTDYLNDTDDLPAGLLKTLMGIEEVETFA